MLIVDKKWVEWKYFKHITALLAVIAAVYQWNIAIYQIQETKAKIKFSEQLKTGIDDLMKATDDIANSKKNR